MVDIPHREVGFVYGIKSLDLIKVGVAMDIDKRLDIMRLHNPHGCELVFYRKTPAPYIFEKRMHELLADKAVGREWFRVSLAELRQAASRVKSSAIKARTSWARWRFDIANFDTPVTQAFDDIAESVIKTGTS